jgi:dCTP deaminase
LCEHENMISPFVLEQVRVNDGKRVISYGLGGFGYDLRLSAKDFRVFRRTGGDVIDPKKFNPDHLFSSKLMKDANGEYFILPGHSYGLGVSIERLAIPDNVEILFIGKSTYARCGIIVNMTPGENGWVGNLTIEISNSTPVDAKIYANEGICQALFFVGDAPQIIYESSRKYQDQPEQVILAKV